MANQLDVDPDWIMTAIFFETGGTFSASTKNRAGSGAVGLIQFMPQTAAALGTSTAALMEMTAEDQLDYVYKYLKPWAHRINSLADLYLAILWPAGIGKKATDVLMWRNDPLKPKNYIQNKGLDFDHDGKITVKEATRRVQEIYDNEKKAIAVSPQPLVVRYGDTNSDGVRILQRALQDMRHQIEDDGDFGPMTGDAFLASFGVRALGDVRGT